MILSVVMVVVAVTMANEVTSQVDHTPQVECGLPDDLAQEIASRYPGRTLVTLDDLDEYDRRLFRKDHGGRCPGLVRVDFFGDRKPTWALLLLQDEAARRTATLVVARQTDSSWEIKQLDAVDAGRSTAPVVWREGHGKYVDAYGQQTLQAKHQTIVLCGYESWAILYAWNGRAVEKMWLSD